MQVEATGRRRREVGVHLHGLVEGQGQVVGHPGEVGIAQLEPLQDDGGAVVVQLEHPVGLDHVVDRAMTDAGRRQYALGEGGAVTHEAERRGSSAAASGPRPTGDRPSVTGRRPDRRRARGPEQRPGDERHRVVDERLEARRVGVRDPLLDPGGRARVSVTSGRRRRPHQPPSPSAPPSPSVRRRRRCRRRRLPPSPSAAAVTVRTIAVGVHRHLDDVAELPVGLDVVVRDAHGFGPYPGKCGPRAARSRPVVSPAWSARWSCCVTARATGTGATCSPAGSTSTSPTRGVTEARRRRRRCSSSTRCCPTWSTRRCSDGPSAPPSWRSTRPSGCGSRCGGRGGSTSATTARCRARTRRRRWPSSARSSSCAGGAPTTCRRRRCPRTTSTRSSTIPNTPRCRPRCGRGPSAWPTSSSAHAPLLVRLDRPRPAAPGRCSSPPTATACGR